jgi:hypothetical protein
MSTGTGRTHDQIVRRWAAAVAVAVAACVLVACGESASDTGRRLREEPTGVTTTAPATVPPGDDGTFGDRGDEIRPLPD